ncbi:MAG: hypothetical protein VW455_08970 [Nitrospinota bacterium]
MNRVIKISILQTVMILASVFLFIGIAQAGSGHHSHHQMEVVSPFDKVSADKPLHCLLNSHLHKVNQDCPHKLQHSKNSLSTELRADCGPSIPNSNGVSFGGVDFPQNSDTDEFEHKLISKRITPLLSEKLLSLPDSFEHPPQLS